MEIKIGLKFKGFGLFMGDTSTTYEITEIKDYGTHRYVICSPNNAVFAEQVLKSYLDLILE